MHRDREEIYLWTFDYSMGKSSLVANYITQFL